MEWLSRFETEYARHFDTPDEFLHGIGCTVAGAALANRVLLRSPDEVSTNLYLILCSPPGWFHKSTPTRAGMRLLKQLLPAGEFLPSNASSESMAKLITLACVDGRGHGILVYDEFRSFLCHIRKEYAANIGTLVVERYERGSDLMFARKKEGNVEVDIVPGGFILSFVASTTTPWLLESMKGSDVTGGMLSRFLLVEAHEKTRTYELPQPIDEAVQVSLGTELIAIRDSFPMKTEFKFRSDAAETYKALYREIQSGAMAHGHPEYPSLVSRAPTYIKKLALISAALSSAKRPTQGGVILPEDVEVAAELVMKSIHSCEAIIDEAVAGDGEYGKTLFRTRKMIQQKGRILKREVLRHSHLRVRALDEILESLKEQGSIKFYKEGKADGIEWVG